MTLKDFKTRMHVGALVGTKMFMRLPDGSYQLVWDIPERAVSISQSNSFAFATKQPDGRVRDSWCNWPKASELNVIDDSTVEVILPPTQGGKVVFKFLVPLEPMNLVITAK